MNSHEVYLEHREALDSAIAAICRRFRVSGVDAEDFASEFRMRLVQEDYATLKQFQGRSSLRTYLHVVVTRAFQDWRNSRWGKWRPSAEARRLGTLAQRLELLVVRDGHTIDEAREILNTNLGLAVEHSTLEGLLARLPVRTRHAFVTDEITDDRPSPDPPPDHAIEQREAASVASFARDALRRVVTRQSVEDRLLLRMRFEDCLPISVIARALGLEQKPLYRRIDGILRHLREALEQEGLTADAAADVWMNDGFSLLAPLDCTSGAAAASPQGAGGYGEMRRP